MKCCTFHSDRGPSFMSTGLKPWPCVKGTATSITNLYKPQDNGQTEQYNDKFTKPMNYL